MKIRVMAAIAVALFAFTSTANARSHHHYRHHAAHHKVLHKRFAAPAYRANELTCNNDGRCVSVAYDANANESRQAVPGRAGYYYEGRIVSHPAGCPGSAFCGCGASVRLFGHPVRDLYLASNWFRFPRAAPAPGMVAVRNHHVFVIEAVNGDGTVVAYDANSGGHQTRVHTVSLSGYSVRDPHGFHMASR